MTAAEGVRLMALLKAAWPRMELGDATLEVYARALSDIDLPAIESAVMDLLQTSTFFPSVAEIREAVAVDRVRLPTPEEAWGIVRRAIGSVGSYRSPVFDCEEIFLAVRDIGWQSLCLDGNPASIRSRFIDAFKSRASRRLEAEVTGRFVPTLTALPATGMDREPGDSRVLVETGYRSPALDTTLLLGGEP